MTKAIFFAFFQAENLYTFRQPDYPKNCVVNSEFIITE